MRPKSNKIIDWFAPILSLTLILLGIQSSPRKLFKFGSINRISSLFGVSPIVSTLHNYAGAG